MVPRLQEQFENEILPGLAESLGRTNRLSLPRLEKIVVSMGVETGESRWRPGMTFPTRVQAVGR